MRLADLVRAEAITLLGPVSDQNEDPKDAWSGHLARFLVRQDGLAPPSSLLSAWTQSLVSSPAG